MVHEKILKDSTALLFLFSLGSIAGIHFFELGYCRYFGIPEEFISFEISKYSLVLFSFLAVFFLLAVLLDGLAGWFSSLGRVRNKVFKILGFTALVIVVVWMGVGYIKFLKQPEAVLLFLVAILGATLWMNSRRADDQYNMIDPKFSILVYLARRYGNIVGPTLILVSLLCVSAFYFGYFMASGRKVFPCLPDGKTILLRKYDQNCIYATYSHETISMIAVQQNASTLDTFHTIIIQHAKVKK